MKSLPQLVASNFSPVAFIGIIGVCSACGPDTGNGNVCKGIVPGDLVITEVFADYVAPSGQSGADAGQEWFELYNAGTKPVDVSGLTLLHSRPDGSKENSHVVATDRNEITLIPGAYLVVGNLDPAVPLDGSPWVTYAYGNDLGELYNSGGGKLTLRCGSTEVDVANYDGIKPGKSRQFDGSTEPEYQINDNLERWCESSNNEFAAGGFGTPGERSDCTPVVAGMCSDSGIMRPTVAPVAGDLVITEYMASPSKSDDAKGEWVEVQAKSDVDLNGLVVDRAGDSSAGDVITDAACLRIAAGSYAVLGKSADVATNGMLPAISALFKFSIVSGSAASPGDIQLLAGATVIDAVRWTKSSNGKSRALDPNASTAASNDDESNFCDGSTAYGAGDFGTPGMANPMCNTVAVGMCNDAGVSRPIVKPSAGTLVITEFIPNPAGTDSDREWFEIKNTGATAFDLNGLGLDREIGDSSAPNLIISPDCKSIAAGQYALFAHRLDPMMNGGLPTVDATFGFAMPTSGDIRVLDGTTVLDKIIWTTAPTNASSALDPDKTNVTDNDTAASFCAAVSPYGDMTNKGTPKADNAQCP
jgi:hypothetical protein